MVNNDLEKDADTTLVKYLLEHSCVILDDRAIVGPLFIRPIEGKYTLNNADSVAVEIINGVLEIDEDTLLFQLQQQLLILLMNAVKLATLKIEEGCVVERCVRADIFISATPNFKNIAIVSYMISNMCKVIFKNTPRPITNTVGCSSVAFASLGSCVFEFKVKNQND